MNSAGFKTGLLIGALGVAVIALGIAVVVLISDDQGENDSATTSSEAAVESSDTDSSGPCVFQTGPVEGEESELDLRTSGLSCEEAIAIHEGLEARDGIEIGSYGHDLARYKGWACVGHPLVAYPLVEHCSTPGKRFLVISLSGVPHSEGAEPPPLPPATVEAQCGDLVDGGAGSYNVVADGVDCGRARLIAALWSEVCFSPDSGPASCPMIYGFSCNQAVIGEELASIQCLKGQRAVSFENGA